MATCKDCLHYEACNAWILHGKTLYSDFDYSTEDCPIFKDRTKWVEQKHGRCEWCEPGNERCGTCLLFFDYYGDGGSDRCSGECDDKKCANYIPMNHCPNCGADMRERREGE